MSKRTIFLLSLSCLFLLTPVLSAVALRAQDSASVDMDYSRISMGGGYSAVGQFVLDDAITRDTAATPQKSARFDIVGIKSESQESTAVDNWEEYN